MNWKTPVAGGRYLHTAAYFLVVGLAFVLASEFFPFHCDVIQPPWSEVDAQRGCGRVGGLRRRQTRRLAATATIFW